MGYQGQMRYRQLCFWGVFTTLLVALTIAGLDVMSAFVVPPWPERELRRMVVARTERPETLQNSSLEKDMGCSRIDERSSLYRSKIH